MLFQQEETSEISAEIAEISSQLATEKAARHEAEQRVLEQSRELSAAKRNVEEVLSGSVKVLTDVLSIARPEVFQKGAKVQRWARQISKKLDVVRPWELDLAAILFPLGAISLQDDLAKKYALCQPLSAAEEKEVSDCGSIAHELISNIPHMRGVADAVLYSGKGYDGSGKPRNDIRGDKIPLNARILKVLIDLADASIGTASRADGFVTMASRKQEYDLDILKVAYMVLLEEENSKSSRDNSALVGAAALRVNDTLLKDIVDKHQALLLAAGADLSEFNIKRIRTMVGDGRLEDKFKVRRTIV